ncbi:hypothetical protein PIB30_111775, partial [Stylosanthes scabra]|nr:hypothetical protein [Stylosanthes scabra]
MEFEQGSYTIFLDNLAALILKGEIYKEFCRFGTITDVYVLRKRRRKCKGPFAFIRFKEYEGAKRAMEWKNGAYWKGKRIHVTLSKYRRSSDWRPTGKEAMGKRKAFHDNRRIRGKKGTIE